MEYGQTPEVYTQQSDAVNSAVAAVSPETKFLGLGLANIQLDLSFFEYFLDSSNHAPSAPPVPAIDCATRMFS